MNCLASSYCFPLFPNQSVSQSVLFSTAIQEPAYKSLWMTPQFHDLPSANDPFLLLCYLFLSAKLGRNMQMVTPAPEEAQ